MISMKKTLALAVLAAACMSTYAADPVRLKFEGLTVPDAASGVRGDVRVDEFYNGGTSYDEVGTPVVSGPALGVSFESTAIVTESFNSANGNGASFSKGRRLLLAGGSAVESDELGTGALYATGDPGGLTSFAMSVPGGFNDALSFFYSTTQSPGFSVSIFSDAGTQTASFTSTPNKVCVGAFNNRCEWTEASLTFVGLATRVVFSGIALDFLVDNITLGSTNPRDTGTTPVVPEPSTYAMLVFGLGALGLRLRRRLPR